jgi:hypothetical protein
MASGDLSVHDADEFAQSLFSSQMATFNDRYTELNYSSEINATETIDGSVTTWNVAIKATAKVCNYFR